MRKNQNKSNYQNKKDIEERVQISKEYCDCEEDIDEAIERSKRKLGSSNAPYGYSKIDEQITTKIYKIPDNQYIDENNVIKEEDYIESQNYGRSAYDNGYYQSEYGYDDKNKYYNNNIYNTEYKKNKTTTSKYFNSNNYNNTEYGDKNANFKLEYISSLKPRNMKYVENYENNYNYNNKTPKTFKKYVNISEGRIENYYENNISKDGQYLVTISLSKIVNEPVPKTYYDDSKNNYSNYKNEKVEVTKNIIKPSQKSYNYKSNNNYSNYKKEKVEVAKNNTNERKTETLASNAKNVSTKERFGYNYNFYERKENTSSAKVANTHQRMRQPYQYEKKEKYTKTQHFISNNSNLPGKEVKTTIKSYKKEVTGNNENKNKGKYNNLQVSNTNQITNNSITKKTETNYKRSGKH